MFQAKLNDTELSCAQGASLAPTVAGFSTSSSIATSEDTCTFGLTWEEIQVICEKPSFWPFESMKLTKCETGLPSHTKSYEIYDTALRVMSWNGFHMYEGTNYTLPPTEDFFPWYRDADKSSARLKQAASVILRDDPLVSVIQQVRSLLYFISHIQRRCTFITIRFGHTTRKLASRTTHFSSTQPR